jgi:hypothetical protein
VDRLVGAQWGGHLSAADIGETGAGSQQGFTAFTRFKAGGVIEIVAEQNRVGRLGLPDARETNRRGTWSADAAQVCAQIANVDGGQRRCYQASINQDGSVTLSGAGVLAGKRFAK